MAGFSASGLPSFFFLTKQLHGSNEWRAGWRFEKSQLRSWAKWATMERTGAVLQNGSMFVLVHCVCSYMARGIWDMSERLGCPYLGCKLDVKQHAANARGKYTYQGWLTHHGFTHWSTADEGSAARACVWGKILMKPASWRSAERRRGLFRLLLMVY